MKGYDEGNNGSDEVLAMGFVFKLIGDLGIRGLFVWIKNNSLGKVADVERYSRFFAVTKILVIAMRMMY